MSCTRIWIPAWRFILRRNGRCKRSTKPTSQPQPQPPLLVLMLHLDLALNLPPHQPSSQPRHMTPAPPLPLPQSHRTPVEVMAPLRRRRSSKPFHSMSRTAALV